MALADNLVAYWPLDEASGNAVDAHSGGYDLSSSLGDPGSAAGKVGNARDFERGTNLDEFSRASNAALQTGDIDFTVAFWFRKESDPGTMTLATKGGDASSTHEWVALYSGGSVYFRVQNAAAVVNVGSSLADATWYFVVGWHDSVNNQIGVALDAGTPATASYSGGVTAASDPFRLATDSGAFGGRMFDGLLDEVGFWKRVLSGAERTELYNSGSGRDYAYITGGGGGGAAVPVFCHHYRQMGVMG